MPSHERLSGEEFVRDSFFQQWVVQPLGEHQIFWKRWLSAHPQPSSTANQARQIVQTPGFQPESANNFDSVAVWEATYENTEMSDHSGHQAATQATEKTVSNRIRLPTVVAGSARALMLRP